MTTPSRLQRDEARRAMRRERKARLAAEYQDCPEFNEWLDAEEERTKPQEDE